MTTPGYGVIFRMGIPAYRPEVCAYIDKEGQAYAMKPYTSPDMARVIIVEVEGDEPTDTQLYTMECVFAVLAVNYNIAALNLCPAILPHLHRIKTGKTHIPPRFLIHA